MIEKLFYLFALFCYSAAVTKSVKFTYYWVAVEADYPRGSEAEIRDCNGGVIARTSAKYAADLKMECSGTLRDGRNVNGANKGCTCFKVVKAPLGSKNNYLAPYVSIAANDISFGSKVYVKELDGIRLPNGKRHNGCVRMDDSSWSFGGNHIDFYVYRKKNYEKMRSLVNNRVTITYPSSCAIQSYGN